MIINAKSPKGADIVINLAESTVSVAEFVDAKINEWGFMSIDGKDCHTVVIEQGKIAIHNDYYKTISDAKQAYLEIVVPGIVELEAAMNAEIAYGEDFESAQEDEMRDGVDMPKRPAQDFESMKSTYPRAAVYLKAKGFLNAANDKKYSAGIAAMKMLLAGGCENEAKALLTGWSK